ncbi:hypothetical protein TNCV_1466051 [Trichonephila clavipes]|nr:hypothetical protein TNCV_1466051 [Trichonephila clavipes]
MPPRRNKETFQQLTEFEWGIIIGLQKWRILLSRNRSSCVQRNSSPVMRAWKKWTEEHRKTGSVGWKPAYLLDMSPIEHVWNLAGWRLARDSRPAALNDEFLLHLQAIWK